MKKTPIVLFLFLFIGTLLIMFSINSRQEINDFSYTEKTEAKQTFSNYYLSRVSTFEKSTVEKSDIIFVGDSLTDYNEWQEYYPNQVVLNRGISGDTIYGVLNRIDEIISRHPKKLFLLIGINDLNRKNEEEKMKKNYTSIIKKLKDQLPETEIYIQSLLPVNEMLLDGKTTNEKILQFNTFLQQLSVETNCIYINLYQSFLEEEQLNRAFTIDGLHLNGNGYISWRKAINEYVKQ